MLPAIPTAVPAVARPAHVILCVDDELPGLRARSMVLEAAGYEVVPTTSANEALEIFKERHIDLVITDHLLQGTTGVEVAKQMRILRPDVPIVIFSGAVDLVQAMDGLRGTKSADLLLSKGAGPTEMLVSLSRLLRL
jgi:CheY-like chemotaxis protein